MLMEQSEPEKDSFYESHFLFLHKKTNDEKGQDLKDWNQGVLTKSKQINKKFVCEELALSLDEPIAAVRK